MDKRVEAARAAIERVYMEDDTDYWALTAATAALSAADAVRAAAPVVPEGFRLVPVDTGPNYSDSSLPHEMIIAGIETLDAVDDDLKNYVCGETIDWDTGMIAVAVYRGMIATAPRIPLSTEEEIRKDERRMLAAKYDALEVEHRRLAKECGARFEEEGFKASQEEAEHDRLANLAATISAAIRQEDKA